MSPDKVAVLGLGEAGSIIAADLVKVGFTVDAWDPQPNRVPPGVNLTKSEWGFIRRCSPPGHRSKAIKQKTLSAQKVLIDRPEDVNGLL